MRARGGVDVVRGAKDSRWTHSVRKGKKKNRDGRLLKLQAERKASERE